MTAYIFDVDGTLTPSRGRIDPEFGAWFVDFARNHSVYLCTGSDRDKTMEQVGELVYNTCQTVYQCSGNDVWVGDTNIRKNDWRLPDEMWSFLENELYRSTWKQYTGNHFDERPGLINFSILGRNAMDHQRKYYIEHDQRTGEREAIAKAFNDRYLRNRVQAQVAGETGLDIMPVGAGKEQVLNDFMPQTVIKFFGDKTMPGGNDHDIAQAVIGWNADSNALQVKDWQQTWSFLRAMV